MHMLEMEYDRHVWKNIKLERIKKHGRRLWKNSFGTNEREQEYIRAKRKQNKREICK